MIRTEVCVESLDGVRIAIAAGADRVELCADLAVDGLTPPPELIADAVAAAAGTGLAVHVLIRCRPGDFWYSPDEVAVMTRQVTQAVDLGADGVVIGALGTDQTVDDAAIEQWLTAVARASAPVAVTFHRAFDQIRDPLAAADTIAALGIARILTSGGRPTALDGANLLAQLVSGGSPQILAGGGIRPDTVAELIGRTRVSEVHFSGRRNGAVDAGVVRATIAAAKAASGLSSSAEAGKE